MPAAFLSPQRAAWSHVSSYYRGLLFAHLLAMLLYSSNVKSGQRININNSHITRRVIFIPEREEVLFSVFYINGLTRRCRVIYI